MSDALLDRLAIPCETCLGVGAVRARDTTERVIPNLSEPCPADCVNGLVPHPDRIEQTARFWFELVGRRSGSTLKFDTAYDSEQADFREQATLLLLADLRHLLGNPK